VFARIAEFVVGAGTLQVHLVNEAEFFHQLNRSKNRRIVRRDAGLKPSGGLDFLKCHRCRCSKKRVKDTLAFFGHAKPLATEPVADFLNRERRFVIRHDAKISAVLR
jgi:hypothetical protein